MSLSLNTLRMHLYLSKLSPLHSTFATEDGQVMFKVDTEPIKLPKRISNISCVISNDIPRKGDNERVGDRFAHLAQIEFNSFGSAVIRFGGNETETKDYFRKGGWGVRGRHRIFTGPDGREYKWILQRFTSELVMNDTAGTPVAKYHRPTLGIIGKARKGSLEIFPTGEHIIETIVITFIYIEKIRKARE